MPAVRLASGEAKPRWALEFGVGVISDNSPDVYYKFALQPDKGPGRGDTYNVTLTRRVGDWTWRLGRVVLHPQFELPFRLTLVDQHEGGLLPDLNVGAAVRWRKLPWSNLLPSTLSIGGGLSYSTRVWTTDILRHPGEHRSDVKFWMPIEFTVGIPGKSNVQLVAFGDHHSGGHIFDRGGVEAWGLGTRVAF